MTRFPNIERAGDALDRVRGALREVFESQTDDYPSEILLPESVVQRMRWGE
ncbi:hypothetical protein [Haladaptatus caseinilyticus]|uniref:hypothetical protein n=1 Tax=Haladaptatus caseinilyticus TaxID=2993314 RepID=UPI00224B1A11|nr:hypothetical protein [Haladaptatus caseinilyticus]